MRTLLEQFKDFVQLKPADEFIDNSDAWYKCAIGQFAKVVGCEGTCLTLFAIKVCGGCTKLYYLLDHSHFKTYGELQRFLANEAQP